MRCVDLRYRLIRKLKKIKSLATLNGLKILLSDVDMIIYGIIDLRRVTKEGDLDKFVKECEKIGVKLVCVQDLGGDFYRMFITGSID